MNTLKRLFVSLKTQVNGIVEDLENHEAVALAAVREVETTAARMNVQLSRAQRQIEDLEARLKDLRTEARRWSERAVQLQADESRALECVRRLRKVQAQIERYEKQRCDGLALKLKLSEDQREVAATLDELKRRREMLLARQYKAQVVMGGDELHLDPRLAVEGIFERWETRIAANELAIGKAAQLDHFAAGLAEEEEQQDLQALLKDLVATAQANPGDEHHD